MLTIDHRMHIRNSDEVRQYSRYIVDEFRKRVENPSPSAVHFNFYETREAFHARHRTPFLDSIIFERQDDHMMIHMCEEDLMGISVLALQGWLNQALSYHSLENDPVIFQFNFSNLIKPLFPTLGLVEDLIRQLVEGLHSALKAYLATRIVVDMGDALPLVHFYFFKINPNSEEIVNYQQMLPHGWIRLLFLSRKLGEFLPLSLLDNMGLSPGLRSFWSKSHGYLLSEDMSLLEGLSMVPTGEAKKHYADTIVKMFLKIRPRLAGNLERSRERSVLHV
jgi:hypothetical protein